MTAPVAPGGLSAARLEQIAAGAQPHPPMRVPFTPQQLLAVAVTDVCIGALDYAGNTLKLLGIADLAKELHGMRDHLRNIGKSIVDQAAKPPKPDLVVAGMDEVPSAAQARERLEAVR